MQTLQFEASWEKAVSKHDRLFIEQLFHRSKSEKQRAISCCLIRKAINHRRQMLITALVHNHTSELLTFQNREVSCLTQHGEIAQKFTIPALAVPPYTSMPWTFIFDDSSDFLLMEILQVEIK
ncbi:SLAP domain-containing protein [Solibacillus silvestris]|uniref:SLAP domain-containing protein n=1 Tax=Solibacillus silvestris TaxID=76853 RepID=UPI003F7EAD81